MKEYRKPVVEIMTEMAEGVYAASGDADNLESGNVKCRFGRAEANPGSDKCQVCSKTDGIRYEKEAGEHFGVLDYKGCPDKMPEKDS